MRENKVRELTDIEHVRARPGMYCGSVQTETFKRWIVRDDDSGMEFREVTFVPGILKLFDEIISNSIDEALRTGFKFANKISIAIDNDRIMVRDNGRGIPVVKMEGSDKTQAEVALTRLRAGANFGDEKFVSIGTHGLGASLVNILSSKFIAWTDDGKKRLILDGMSGKVVASTKDNGTYVEFVPDYSIFDCKDISGDLFQLIQKRVTDLAVCFPKIQFRFDGSVVKSKKFKDYVALFGDDAIILETPKASIAVISSDEPNQVSFLNGIDTYEGGTHVDFVRRQVIGEVLDRLNKKYKKLKLKPSDVRNHLTFFVLTNDVASPKFRSQTKEYVTNNFGDYTGILDGIDETNFIARILKSDALVDPIIETKKLKIDAADAVALKKSKKEVKKIKVAKHVPANGPVDKTILYITEGQSASGMLTKIRDTMIHGCYPLRGKPLNTFDMRELDIVKNTEMKELMAILGLEFGKSDFINPSYSKIRIMADADHDGHSIVGLLLVFFSRWPWLFKRGIISVVRCPIIIATQGKKSERIYDFRVWEQKLEIGEVDSSWSISYFKGLGSLTENEYSDMVHDPVEDVIGEMSKDDTEALNIAFGPSADLRKVWLMGV